MDIAIVAGSFNDAGGKRSGWAEKLMLALKPYSNILNYVNGGTWEQLVNTYDSLNNSGTILWFADVPNDKEKLIKDLKLKYPKTLLVSSKRNLDNSYSFQDLVSRALAIKANLTIEITGTRDNVQSTIIDPLGNVFLNKENNIEKLAIQLISRLKDLEKAQRVSTFQLGDKISLPYNNEVNSFLDIVKSQAEVFHSIIHGVNTTRMLGNASFRCARGFPSFREKDLIFVSQRNIDKRYIDIENFVACKIDNGKIGYYGENKPSVDTPVQLALYEYYKNVNFMLHSHTYIEEAPITNKVLPCGDLAEAQEIFNLIDSSKTDFNINIKGHGSICMASSVDFLKKVKWIARPTPEFH